MQFPRPSSLAFPALVALAFVTLVGAGPLSAQVVLRKPARPVEVMEPAPAPSEKHVLKQGTWKWSSHKHAYEWRPRKWVLPKGKKTQFQQGYWRKKKKGWEWVPGKWVKPS